MEKNQLLLIGLVIAALLGFVFFMSLGSSGTPAFKLPDDFKIQTVTATDHVLGSPDAPVTVVEYSDYECPACSLYATVLNDLSKEYSTSTAFVYRHFPLRQIHVNSSLAAQAAEAADQQGKFWEMSQTLFEKQADWSALTDPKVKFVEYVTQLGMNEATFVSHYDATSTKDKIDEAFNIATALKLNHTPTFFVNDTEVTGDFATIDDFKTKVREMIAAVR